MGVSRMRLFFAQYDNAIGTAILAILIFVLGWYAGRVMSPYYASSPIVFEDRTCDVCPASQGSLQDLLEKSPGTKPPETSVETRTGQPGGQEVPAGQQGVYVASKNSNLFHHYTCAPAKTIKPENRVWYATYEEAQSAGLSPSACTQKLSNP